MRDENISSAHVDEVLGADWEAKIYPSGKSVTIEQKKNAKFMQQEVMKYVSDELLANGLIKPFKGLAFSTFVYACALKPDCAIVKLLLRRLLLEYEEALHSNEDDLACQEVRWTVQQ